MIHLRSFYSAMLVLFLISIITPCTFSNEPNAEKVTPPGLLRKNNRSHHIIINALFDYTIVRDKIISPLLYHGLGGGLTLGYEYRSMRHEQRILLYLMGGGLTRPGIDTVPGRGRSKNTFPSFLAQYSFEYSFVIPVMRIQQWQLSVGGMMATSVEIRAYANVWNPVALSFSSTWDFGPVIATMWNIAPRHNLQFRLTMPLMSLVKRPGWSIATPQMEFDLNRNILLLLYANPRVTSVHEWLRLSFEFKHEWELTKLIQLNTEYRSTLLISNIPRFFGMFSNQVSVGVSFRL